MPQNTGPGQENWYSGGEEARQKSDWYAAMPPKSPGPAAPAPEEYTGGRMKVLSLTVCGVLVCAAAVIAVLNSGFVQRLRGMELQGSDRAYSYAYDFGDGGGASPVLPEEQYDDFRDYFENYYTGSGEVDIPRAPTDTGMRLTLQAQRGEELSLREIYDRVGPAVVSITAYVDGEEYSWGTGACFDGDGYIVTNTHILQSADRARVVFPDGRDFEALLVGADESSDIAVLKAEGGQDLPWAEFGRSAALRVGDQVAAIGNPLGEIYSGTMTNGIISAIDRSVTYQGHTMTLLQTNAALNEGNSGGPLINGEGQVVGITNMKVMGSFAASVEGIGFAIPSSVVKSIADELLEKGVVSGEPTIGIVAGSVNDEAMALYGLPSGIYVTEVSEGSDARAKGLREGDVITAVNGIHVTAVDQVNAIKEGMSVGDSITVSVYRDGETFDLDIDLVDKGDIR